MTSSAWLPILLALPVLLLGEWLVRRIKFIARCSIPAPVVSGLLVALVVLVLNLTRTSDVQLASKVTTPWWTWIVSTEPEWFTHPAKTLSLPLMVGFFTCIGLNATWDVVKRGSLPLLIFLGVATLLSVTQNLAGVAAAKSIGAHPFLGLMCGSITMTGGHATAYSFATQLEEGGLVSASVIGAAAATLGLVVGALMAGPVGAWLIRQHKLKGEPVTAENAVAGPAQGGGIFHDARSLRPWGRTALLHLVVVVLCIKAGAWLSYLIQMTGITFPIHMGAMIAGIVLRNALDLSGCRWLRSEVIVPLGSVLLALFLTFAMMGLNLMELANVALPMLCVLAVQFVVMVLFAVWVAWRIMGRSYEAAIMSAGLCGFGIGNTANAVASMKALVESHGAAPRAFLIVPLVGTLLGDLTNLLNITIFINVLR
jgi:ESS family glutamate:Na+ symporter